MKGRSFHTATALLAGIAIVAAAGVASAQVDKDNAKCRSTIFKTQSKLAATAGKAVAGCYKNVLKGKAPASTDCNNPSTADTKNKLPKAESKLSDSLGGAKAKCDDTTHAATLAEFPSCPSPGTPGAITSFSQLASCEIELAENMVENFARRILNPDAAKIVAMVNAKSPEGKQLSKCAQSIIKNATKLHATVQKDRGKCQTTADKGGGSFAYSCSTFDSGKIAGTIAKLEAKLDKDCHLKKDSNGNERDLSEGELGLLGSCGRTIAELKSCIVDSVVKNAGGLTALAFQNAEVCPTVVDIVAKAGSARDGQGGFATATQLDTGWNGLGHNVDVVDGFHGSVNLDCSASTSCDTCTVTVNCRAGGCRCSNDVTQQCNTPFVEDICGAGNTCEVFFGPPLALNASNAPVCVVNKIPVELIGSADVGTGSSLTTVSNVATVFTGIGQTQPCPICDAGPNPSLGDAGTCVGGARAGLSCTVDAIHPTFGPSSFDCQPDLGQNISGTGLKLTLQLTDGDANLPAGLTCNGSDLCPCGVCTGDVTLPCTSDADCAAQSAGTCSTAAGSVWPAPRPDGCNTPGECTAGSDPDEATCSATSTSFCDGFVRASGRGMQPCTTNADCTTGGSCTITEDNPCFLDPIHATGRPGQDGAVLVSTFCTPPVNSSSVNNAAGSPGPGRIHIAWDFTGFCPDGVTPWELGGANCP